MYKIWLFKWRYAYHVKASTKYGQTPMEYDDWKDLIVTLDYTVQRQLWGIIKFCVLKALGLIHYA